VGSAGFRHNRPEPVRTHEPFRRAAFPCGASPGAVRTPMSFSRIASEGSGPVRSESILVHGPDRIGVTAFTAGLAIRSLGGFAWADCGGSAPREDDPIHWILSRGSPLPALARVDPSVLLPPPHSAPGLQALVALDGEPEERRLAQFLDLPELFQRLGARAPEFQGRVALLLANVDRLLATPSGRALEQRELHDRLHSAGMTLFATSTPAPSPRLREVFDRVFRIDVPAGSTWSHGLLSLEQAPTGEPTPDRIPLREGWSRLGLDSSFLPPL
jgi:hypothetical protein